MLLFYYPNSYKSTTTDAAALDVISSSSLLQMKAQELVSFVYAMQL